QDNNIKEYLRHPVMIFFLLDISMSMLQLVNPNAMGISGWIVEFRFAIYKAAAIYVLLNFFNKKKHLTNFVLIMLILSTIAGIYGVFHKFFGLFGFEEAWLKASEVRYNLIVLFGIMRVWSYLAGPAEFGLLMAYTSVFALVLIFSKGIAMRYKVYLGFAAIFMLLGMVYSGTRTAFVAFPAGVALFFLMTMNKIRTVVISILVILTFMVIYFGPFYNASIIRLRSAFEGSDDPSMNIRMVNRERIQPYMYKNILGGGPGTTGLAALDQFPGHPLAGFPPDSYYLRVGLEKGIIALIIIMGLFVAVIQSGIKKYFSCRDPVLKAYIGAFTCSFFAICLANYTQEGIGFRPMDILVLSTYVLVIKIKKLEGNKH
ncbi:MAG: O-antigen ligase family protein, partial [Fulvivirga sp.]|nr:O-antigen ligase family protein [Fulvivirga sp.]